MHEAFKGGSPPFVLRKKTARGGAPSGGKVGGKSDKKP